MDTAARFKYLNSLLSTSLHTFASRQLYMWAHMCTVACPMLTSKLAWPTRGWGRPGVCRGTSVTGELLFVKN